MIPKLLKPVIFLIASSRGEEIHVRASRNFITDQLCLLGLGKVDLDLGLQWTNIKIIFELLKCNKQPVSGSSADDFYGTNHNTFNSQVVEHIYINLHFEN